MKALARLIWAGMLASALVLIAPASAQAPTFHKQIKPKRVISLAMTQPKEYAHRILLKKGWSLSDFKCLVILWTNESHWNYKARSYSSTAYGIWQGITETSHDPATQIRNGVRYIERRYGDSCSALRFWQAQHPHWY